MRLLVVSDLHDASYYGLLSKECRFEDSMTGEKLFIQQMETQKKMYKLWKDMTETVGYVDAVIVNGDVCDGPQCKSKGKFVVTSDLKAQADDAIRLLSMIDSKTFYFTQGSEYHSIEDRPLEQYIAEMMNAEYGNELLLDFKNVRFHVAHYISFSSNMLYRSTPLVRDMMFLKLNNAMDEYGEVDWTIRSHAHYAMVVQYGHTGGIITPCWQARTPYAVKKGIVGMSSNGYDVIDINGKKDVTVKQVVTKVGVPCKVIKYVK